MNACGTCTACCVLLPIVALGKQAGRPCRKLVTAGPEPGCSIYPSRPEACRSFACGWLAEGWDDDLRPDVCGVMLTHQPCPAGFVLTAWELTPGTMRAAWDLWVERAREAPIAVILRAAPAVLLKRDGSTVPIPSPYR